MSRLPVASETSFSSITPALPSETKALVTIGLATGLFSPEEADVLLRNVLDELHAGRLGAGHAALVFRAPGDTNPRGWVYFGPNKPSNGVWELWWIGVSPEHQGRGVGDALLCFVECEARSAGARLLLIETSALPALEQTRRFYSRRSYLQCGVIPDFYAEGDGKVTFAKKLQTAAAISAP